MSSLSPNCTDLHTVGGTLPMQTWRTARTNVLLVLIGNPFPTLTLCVHILILAWGCEDMVVSEKKLNRTGANTFCCLTQVYIMMSNSPDTLTCALTDSLVLWWRAMGMQTNLSGRRYFLTYTFNRGSQLTVSYTQARSLIGKWGFSSDKFRPNTHSLV